MNKNEKSYSPSTLAWLVALGQRIRVLREQCNLSQRDVAAMAKLDSPDSFTRVERGIAGRLNAELVAVVMQLAERCGYDANWLFLGELRGAERMRDYDWLYHAEKVDVEREANNLEWATTVLRQVAQRKDMPDDLSNFLSTLSQGAFKRPSAMAPPSSRVAITLHEAGFQSVPGGELPPEWRGKYVPILGRLAAGSGIDTSEAESYPPGWAEQFVPYPRAKTGMFAVQVSGDSMMPRYAEGDLVVVDGSKRVNAGVCCVILKGPGTREPKLKRLSIHGSRAVLESLNPKYPPVDALAQQVDAYAIVAHLPAVKKTKL